ncbi:MAG: ATP-binding protein, partial [Usitatibacteraceae bacterium]
CGQRHVSTARETVRLHDDRAILLVVDPASLAIADVSKPTLKLLGYRREELLGKQITDIECALTDSFFWDGVRMGDPADARNAECSYRCSSGDILSATKTVSRVTGDGDDWLIVRAEPLPAGPRLEDQLAAIASTLRATLEATADGILVLDRHGKIINMNRKFSRMWEMSDSLLLLHDDSAVFGHMAALFKDPYEYRLALSNIALDADGETAHLLHLADGRFFERKSMPAKHGKHIFGRVFSFTDITEQKRANAARESLEVQLRESQKMEAIGTLAGGIAHDFNNILATILGNTELARQDASDNAQALESLEEIRKAGTRARDLVQQILSFSRRQPTPRKLIALCPVIQESVRVLRATLPARVTIEVQCEPDVPPVLSDATQLGQVIINLATNAVHAMHGGPGRIDVRLDTVILDSTLLAANSMLRELDEKHSGPKVRLTVRDNGRGMDAATVSRIFEPFFTTKPLDEGTGLGLSVVHGIVRGHDGAIVVDSAPGKGATFTIYLPTGG